MSTMRFRALLTIAALALGVAGVAPRAAAQATLGLKWGRADGNDAKAGGAPGEFFDPENIAVDAGGDLWVADVLNHRVQRFGPGGAYVDEFGTFGTGAGQFNSPRGVAVDVAGTGEIYVVDSLNDRVQVFAADGTFQRQWGSSGAGNGQFAFPRDVALDGSGNVFVTDMDNHRVQKFTQAGAFVAAWGGLGTADGEFQYPRGIAVSDSGDVFVVDSFNHRVQHFANDGTFVSRFGANGGDGTFGSGDGEFNTPRGLAVVGDSIYVADTGNDRVQLFVSESYTSQFGSLGPGDGELNTPRGVAFRLAATSVIYVADSGNHRIDAFGTVLPAGSGTFTVPAPNVAAAAERDRRTAGTAPLEVELLPLGPDPGRLTAEVRYQLTAPGRVALRVEDGSGRVLGTLASGWQDAGVHTVRWDAAGAPRAAGAEVVYRLEAEGALTTRSVTLR
jgi:DNA-binding beta-propeller fold protein YncE